MLKIGLILLPTRARSFAYFLKISSSPRYRTRVYWNFTVAIRNNNKHKIMKTTALKIVGIILLSFTTFSCSPYFTDDMSEEVGTTVDKVNYTNLELDLLRGINSYRNDLGLSSLETFNVISAIAEQHSQYMLEIGETTKDNASDRASKLAINANASQSSEIIYATSKKASEILTDWKNDTVCTEEFENRDFTHFGIGIKTDSNGKHYITLIFIEEFESKFSN